MKGRSMKVQQTGMGFAYNQKQNTVLSQKNNKTQQPQNMNGTPYVGAYYMPVINFRGDSEKVLVTKKDEAGNKILDKYGNPVIRLNPEIKKAMDKETFEFTGPDGEKFTGTVKEALLAYIRDIRDLDENRYSGLYHGSSLESIKKIKEQGPDPRKTTSVGFGPGMYFAFSEGDAHDYSGAKIKADLQKHKREDGVTGKFAVFNGLFYRNIKTPEVAKKLQEITPTSTDIDSLLNDYCREILVDDLKIDAGYGFARSHHPCVIVFNPDVISNIRNSNEY